MQCRDCTIPEDVRDHEVQDQDILDRLIEISRRLGVAENKADSASQAITSHTTECLQFRAGIMSKIDKNREAAEQRHSDLINTLAGISRAQDKALIKIGAAIITLMISGFGALALMWLQLHVTK